MSVNQSIAVLNSEFTADIRGRKLIRATAIPGPSAGTNSLSPGLANGDQSKLSAVSGALAANFVGFDDHQRLRG
jgi:hypothetical protein